MSKRSDTLGAIRFAGYHGDSRTAIRLALDNRVSNKILREQFALGAQRRAEGVRCGCHECKTPNPKGQDANATTNQSSV